MKIRTLGGLIGLSALVSTFVSCSQAKVVCLVGHAGSQIGYAVTYTLKPGANTCSMTIDASGVPIDQIKGDIIGFESYHPENPTNGSMPDFTKTTVAFQADSLGVLRLDKAAREAADTTEGHHAYAFGSFANVEPDADNFCPVKDIQPAEMSFPAVEEEKDDNRKVLWQAEPKLDIKYEWSNLKLYVTAAAPGTQFSGDLKYTKDGCTVEYHAVGLWPAVDCGTYDSYTNDLKDTDPTACLPEADPAAGRPVGSGINPDFPVECTVIRDKGANRKVLDVVCKDQAGKTATVTEDGTCPLAGAVVDCVDVNKADEVVVSNPADGKCPAGSKPTLVVICQNESDASILTDSKAGKCAEGSKTKIDVVYLRDVVCKAKTGDVKAVTTTGGECDAMTSDLVCEDKDHNEVIATKANTCPEGSTPKLDVIYQDETGKRVEVPITADGMTPPGVQPRPKLENLYPGLALCALKGEPPAFKTKTR